MRAAIMVLVGLLCLVAVSRAASHKVADNTAAETPEEPSQASDLVEAALDTVAEIDPVAIMDRNTIEQDQGDTNCDAFLQMIAQAEGTAGAADQYAVCYAYSHTVQDFAQHPAAYHDDGNGGKTREWSGVPLDKLGPSYAGKVSTAAGRYQIINPTWQGCRRALSLPDFGPDSQDKAALYLIRERRALDDVRAGNFDGAVAKLANTQPPGVQSNAVWASLPGANAPGQAMRKLGDLRAAYVQAGGALA